MEQPYPEEDVTPNRFRPRPVDSQQRGFGPFRLLHELGAGGTATLYLATDELGRLVALKQLHRHLCDNPRFIDMFQDEASIAARINHPNVCKVFSADSWKGQPYIAMEYVHGESLACLFQEMRALSEQLPLDAVTHLVGQACLGLHAAHEQADDEGRPLRIVHRDISPQNLLVTYEGELKVVDFGIASAAERLHRTETGTLKGKIPYMSPEQTRSSRVDRRSDIFSLGAVLYEGACGHRCFRASTAAATLQQVQQVSYVQPRTLRPDLPPALEQVVARAMAPRPQDRYPDAAAMYRDLYLFLTTTQSAITTRSLGQMLRRIFAPRYAMREELQALAFAAPDVLEEEELTLEERPDLLTARCDFCGEAAASEQELAQHMAQCGQRRWWEHNFGQMAPAAASALVRPAIDEPQRVGWLGRLKQRIVSIRGKKDPLLVRLRGIEARLESVRDHQTQELSARGMTALFGLVAELQQGKSEHSATLLGRLKPRILRCANTLLATSLEIEANAAYLASTGTRDLRGEADLLQRRLQSTSLSDEVRHELERNLRGKRALIDERERVAGAIEVRVLRLESMVDVLELTVGKVLQIVGSPLDGRAEAITQITVFLDSLVLELDRLAQAMRELDHSLQGQS